MFVDLPSVIHIGYQINNSSVLSVYIIIPDKMSSGGALLHHGGWPLDLAQGVGPGYFRRPGKASSAAPSVHTQPLALGPSACRN